MIIFVPKLLMHVCMVGKHTEKKSKPCVFLRKSGLTKRVNLGCNVRGKILEAA